MADHPLDEEALGGIVWNPHHQYSKEMRKHEANWTVYGPPGRPYKFEPYPKAMYKAHVVNGKVRCYEADPDPLFYPDVHSYERAVREADSLRQRAFRKVENEEQERKAMNEGWRPTIQAAMDALEACMQEVGNESARVNFSAQRMSAGAQQELREAGDATAQHVVDVAPKRKRGRPTRGVQPVTGDGVKETDA